MPVDRPCYVRLDAVYIAARRDRLDGGRDGPGQVGGEVTGPSKSDDVEAHRALVVQSRQGGARHRARRGREGPNQRARTASPRRCSRRPAVQGYAGPADIDCGHEGRACDVRRVGAGRCPRPGSDELARWLGALWPWPPPSPPPTATERRWPSALTRSADDDVGDERHPCGRLCSLAGSGVFCLPPPTTGRLAHLPGFWRACTTDAPQANVYKGQRGQTRVMLKGPLSCTVAHTPGSRSRRPQH